MKLVKENLNEFERSGSALDNLNIGLFRPGSSYEASIKYAYGIIKNDERFVIKTEPENERFFYIIRYEYKNTRKNKLTNRILYILYDFEDETYKMNTINVKENIEYEIKSLEDFNKIYNML
jgi:hypothetical protein